MGSVNLDNTGSGSAITLSSDGTDLLLNGTAIGGGSGGGGASTVVTKPDAYTVVSSDLGKILVFTGSWNEYATLGSASTLGSGFYVTITNQSGSTHLINRSGSDQISPNGSSGNSSYKLASGASVTLISDGTSKWLIKSISPYLYAECNANSGNFDPTATGSGSVALGRSASASGNASFAAGANSSYGGSTATGAGSVALGGSYASGTESFAAAIANNSTSYGASGANSVAIGKEAKVTASESIAIGHKCFASGANSVSIAGYYARSEAVASVSIGNYSLSENEGAVAIGPYSQAKTTGKVAFNASNSGSMSHGAGKQQRGLYVLKANTTDATQKVLTGNGSTPAASNSWIIGTAAAQAFSGTLIARQDRDGGHDYAAWEIKGAAIKNATVVDLGQAIINSIYHTSGASAWAVSVSANTSLGTIEIKVTGAASTDIDWVATIDTSEVVNI